MPELSKKLDRFTAAILAQATAETEQAMAALRQKRKQARQEAEDQILQDAYRYIQSEVSRIKAETGRQVSRHLLDNKRALYRRRDEIAQEVFSLVRERIAAFTGTPAYSQRLQELFLEALDCLSGAQDIVVYLRPVDLDHAGALRAAGGVPAVFAEGHFQIGGLIAESQSLGRRADASFDSAMDALSGHFAELFGLSLAGGA